MLVGIIGKIGHGKDTVADFIRRNSETVYTVRRFADPLKECVASILNCSVLDLEDRDFKERPLGPEWNTYTDGVSKFFNTREEAEEAVAHLRQVTCVDHQVTEIVNTPRRMLQTLGTEWGRDIIHPNIWVNSLMGLYEQSRVNGPSNNYPDWLIPDVRFPNEAQAIKERGGLLIKVERPDGSDGDHISEKLVDILPYDRRISNDTTLEDLEDKVRSLISEGVV